MNAYKKQFPANNMFIEASAGTGKTFTITEIVKQLTDSDIPLESILIVTYTEKAAGELKDRIRARLKRDSIDTAPIFTIHSFCQQTIAEFAFNARTAYEQDMIDEGEIASFIERLIRDELKNEERFCYLYENDKSFLTHIRDQLTGGVKLYYQNLQGCAVPEIVTLDTSEDDWDELQQAFEAAKNDTARKAAVNAMVKLYFEEKLPEIYRRWQDEKRSAKAQSFDDMLRTVREAVRNPATGLQEALKQKYRYAIIDEFQDTNQKQWDIFTALFTDETHHLIVVGDPKQSIYAFQGANVQVYKTAIESIEKNGGDAYSLSNNWRSSEQLIKAFNALFSSQFFDENNCCYTDSLPPPDATKRIPPPLLYNEETGTWEPIKPVWMAEQSNAKTFAKASVQQILRFAGKAPDGSGRTCLQIGAKTEGGYTRRSVSFKDFAVLARSRAEMDDIVRELKITGIPFRRYKDDKVFATRECQNWISLFRAICAPDFSGTNRTILSECLFTDFFRTERTANNVASQLTAIEDSCYDAPDCAERRVLAKWKHLSEKERWAELLEAIYEDTGIETRFSALDELDSLARYRQLGDYALEYLYAHSCTLEDLVAHLERLLQRSETAENDANLLAKNTDFDCVQVMTIHASKGLEFPVVIAVAGFKGEKTKSTINLPCQFNAGGRTHLSFDNSKKDAVIAEGRLEWQRLYYVAYTRPTQLLLLPQYEEWMDSKGEELECFQFLKNSFDTFQKKHSDLCTLFAYKDERLQDLKAKVQAILAPADNVAPAGNDSVTGASVEDAAADSPSAEDAQRTALSETKKAVTRSMVRQHSYTTLTGKKESAETDEGRLDRAEETADGSTAGFDMNALAISALYKKGAPSLASRSYPKGKYIGIALHEIFEKADFEALGRLTEQEAVADETLQTLIRESMRRQSVQADDILEPTARAVWHTLHAALPRIQGTAAGNNFSLHELPVSARKAEIEFELNPCTGVSLADFCKGFIDLLFLRQDADGERYCILDWKSDQLPPEAYSDGKALKAKVDDDYAIQRTLYSYSLIQWLKQFYPGADEETIMREHFGGIYYVFVRGCSAGTGNGIYAQTWQSWNDLQTAFNEITGARIGKR